MVVNILLPSSPKVSGTKNGLVGGWTNPFETYIISQLGSFPQIRGENNKCLKPPSSGGTVPKKAVLGGQASLTDDQHLLNDSTLIQPHTWIQSLKIFRKKVFTLLDDSLRNLGRADPVSISKTLKILWNIDFPQKLASFVGKHTQKIERYGKNHSHNKSPWLILGLTVPSVESLFRWWTKCI